MSSDRARWPGVVARGLAGVARVAVFLVLLDLLLFAVFDVLPSAELAQIGIFAMDPALLQTARERMGTAGPWHERLTAHWLALAQGSMGYSLVGNYPIGEVIGRRLLRSLPLWLGTLALLPLGVVIAMPYATRRQNRLLVIGKWLGQLAGVPQFLSAVACFVAWIALSQGFGPAGAGVLKWALAVLSCAALPFGVLFVAAANTFERSAAAPFVDTYRSIGMGWPTIRRRLLLNAVVALRPLMARLVLWTITGSVLTETIFGINGFGQLLVEAMRNSDLNVARSWMLLVGGAVLAVTEVERR